MRYQYNSKGGRQSAITTLSDMPSGLFPNTSSARLLSGDRYGLSTRGTPTAETMRLRKEGTG